MSGLDEDELNAYPFIDTESGNLAQILHRPPNESAALLAVFVNDIPASKTVDYLIKRLSATNVCGGPEFIVQTYNFTDTDEQTILLLDCKNDRLLREAERCMLRKRTLNTGDVLPFSTQSQQRSGFRFGNLARLLVSSEKIRLATQILSRVCVNAQDLRENPDLKLGEPLISQLSVISIVGDILPLHDIGELHKLGAEWHSAKLTMFEPCYDRIRDYFGEKIAIYFAFLGYYTKALILPSFLALYNCLLWFESDNMHAQAPFAAFNLIYLTIFLKFWKRRCNTLAYRWGTLGFAKYEMPRPDYKGNLHQSPITGRIEMWFPGSSRLRIMVCETYPIVAFCLVLSVVAMWGYFVAQLHVEKHYALWTWRDVFILNLPTIIYSLLIELSNCLYKMLARKLTFRENHRFPSDHEYHLILKLISFQFVNCFVYLFYVAFILQDMARLRRYLACSLVTMQIVQQIFECVWPFIRIHLSKQYTILKARRSSSGAYINDIAQEAKLGVYEDTFDDYLELWCQFGYALMFSSVFPLAAFYALANNLVEMRSDAFKLCVTMRRPFPQMADSMGIWRSAFDALIVVAIITNCALLGMAAANHSLYFKKWPLWHIVLLFVLVEHCMFFIHYAVNKLINDVPGHIRIRLARSEYLTDPHQDICSVLDIGQVSEAARRSKPSTAKRLSVSSHPAAL